MISLNQDITAPGLKKTTVRLTMLQVIFALVPGTVAYAILIDAQILTNLIIATISGLCTEAICQILRKRSAFNAISDCSTFVAIWLLVLCIPPSLPAWQLILGAFVLVTLGKQVFGGLGNNPFNPAMLAYAFLLVSFPVTMTSWDSIQSQENNTRSLDSSQLSNSNDTRADNVYESLIDGVSGATVLDQLRDLKRSINAHNLDVLATGESTAVSSATTPSQTVLDWSVDRVFSSSWLWVSVCWVLGGIYLLFKKIISWHIPISVLLTIGLLYALVGALGTSLILPAGAALFTGGLTLGAFFIATDPVSAPVSRQSQILYGCGIGIFTFVIREYSVYPEGFAFAILLMNMCVPLLDHASTGRSGTIRSSGKQR